MKAENAGGEHPRRIYVDFDDVLCQTARALRDAVSARFGRHVEFEDIRSFDLRESFRLTERETEVLTDLFHDESLLAGLEPVPGAVDALTAWADRGYAVWIVTGRPPPTYEGSREWLVRREVPFQRLVMVDKYGRKHAVREGVPTLGLDEIGGQGFCLAVEDSLDVARYLLRNTVLPVALLNRPWNRDGLAVEDAASGRLHRCGDWWELLRRFPAP